MSIKINHKWAGGGETEELCLVPHNRPCHCHENLVRKSGCKWISWAFLATTELPQKLTELLSEELIYT